MNGQATGTELLLDAEGYLQQSEQWSETFARDTAQRRGVVLTDAHWTVINFLRGYYEEFRYAPDFGTLAKALRDSTHDRAWTRTSLKNLFQDDNPCRYAGLPKPPPGSCV